MEELARPAGTSYRDESVAYGDSFAYTLATVVGGEVSLPGGEASVTLSPLLPLGITFVNANYEVRPANANTVAWNPVLPVARRSETGKENRASGTWIRGLPPGFETLIHRCGCRRIANLSRSDRPLANYYDIFRNSGVTRTGPGGQNVTLSFTTLAGAAYRVHQSRSLTAGSWTETGVSAAGTGAVQSLTVPAAVTGGAPRRYLRVVRE